MRRCLNEKELLMVHAGDGAVSEREHLECCLSCARRYRELQADMEKLVTALRHPPVAQKARHSSGGGMLWPRGIRWALAASVVLAAFAGGRMSGLSGIRAAASASGTSRDAASGQVAMADVRADTPAGYGLYIDDLVGPDSSDQDQPTDSPGYVDGQLDSDSAAF
jgi:hypothetical protein